MDRRDACKGLVAIIAGLGLASCKGPSPMSADLPGVGFWSRKFKVNYVASDADSLPSLHITVREGKTVGNTANFYVHATDWNYEEKLLGELQPVSGICLLEDGMPILVKHNTDTLETAITHNSPGKHIYKAVVKDCAGSIIESHPITINYLGS